MGLSLWLVPAVQEMKLIKTGFPGYPPVNRDKTTFSPGSYPIIIPHITLATVPNFSDPKIPDLLLESVPKSEQLIRANFQSLVVGDHYFRSVFIGIQPTPELISFHNQILTNLCRCGLEPSAPRFPHMSLCYIADEDKSDRSRMAQALRDTGVIASTDVHGEQLISLKCGDVRLSGFDGSEVWMVDCEGPVETWQADERIVELSPK